MSLTPLEIERLADAIADKIAERLAGMPAKSSDGYLDSHEAAELIGCSVPTIERHTRSGRLPSVKLGRLRRYRHSDVMRLTAEG